MHVRVVNRPESPRATVVSTVFGWDGHASTVETRLQRSSPAADGNPGALAERIARPHERAGEPIKDAADE